MTGITRQLAEFAANLKPKDIPEEVVARTRLLILDITGIMVRARHDAESTPSMMGAIQRLGLNQGRYLVLGDPTGYASSAAALINGTLAHSLDFDDTHAAASLHSSALYKEGRASKAEVLRLTKKEKSQNSRWMLWADLMKRVFQEDVSCCVRCGGRMELRAVVIRPPATLKVLAGLVRSERGRDPPGEVTGWGSE
ncbi:MAG TPA: hypothetical protein EYQ29_09875 [Candidatus Lambdaproteobacteria bacterium]|jgi:hypothetical protein|nr:hypothetical protein [Candidatus Lambdaproteobacteria bacterium]